MAATLCDRAVRVELGISRVIAARLAGVDRRTLAMWEAGPQFVKDESADRCRSLYRLFREVLLHAPGRREG